MPKTDPKLGKSRKGKITQGELREGRQRAKDAPSTYSVGTYSTRGSFSGAPAPRVGGSYTSQSPPLRIASKKIMKAARRISRGKRRR